MGEVGGGGRGGGQWIPAWDLISRLPSPRFHLQPGRFTAVEVGDGAPLSADGSGPDVVVRCTPSLSSLLPADGLTRSPISGDSEAVEPGLFGAAFGGSPNEEFAAVPSTLCPLSSFVSSVVVSSLSPTSSQIICTDDDGGGGDDDDDEQSDTNAICDCSAYAIEVPSSSATFSIVASSSLFDSSVVVIPSSPTTSDIIPTDDDDDDGDEQSDSSSTFFDTVSAVSGGGPGEEFATESSTVCLSWSFDSSFVVVPSSPTT